MTSVRSGLAVIGILALGWYGSARAQPPVSAISINPANVIYVYDGDTFYVQCIDGFPCTDGMLGIRVKNIDTAEINGKCREEIAMARVAKDAAKNVISATRDIRLTYSTERPLDKYDRLLANVSLDGRDLGKDMVDAGIARPWTGKRRSWCRTGA